MAGARQPIELIKSNGKKHLTKKEIKERESQEMKVSSNNIIAPSFLTEPQKEIFYKLSYELENVGVMSNVDCNALARYVIAQENYEKVTVTMNIVGMEDIVTYAACSKMQGKFLEQCLKLEKEFGMTVSSRCKIVTPKKEPKANPLRKALI